MFAQDTTVQNAQEWKAIGNWAATHAMPYCLGVIFTALVALRAFYIQKRHERMADKFGQFFEGLRVQRSYLRKLMHHAPVVGSAQDQLNEALGKFQLNIKLASIYFTNAMNTLIAEMEAEADQIKRNATVSNLEHIYGLLHESYGRHFEIMIEQARRDLRPDVKTFIEEFFGD